MVQLIAEGSNKLASVPSGGGGGGGGGGAAAASGGAAAGGDAAAEEEKPAEKEEEKEVRIESVTVSLLPLAYLWVLIGVRRRHGLRSFRLRYKAFYIIIKCTNSKREMVLSIIDHAVSLSIHSRAIGLNVDNLDSLNSLVAILALWVVLSRVGNLISS